MPKRLVIDPQKATFEELAPAARILLDGGIAVGPTQSFYALMALVDNHQALAKINNLKGNREQKTNLILLDQEPRVRCYAREVPDEAAGLMKYFWPGPLTLLFLAQPGLHPSLVGPARTVGLRLEGLASIRRLGRLVDRGLTGTSANLSGALPATTAEEACDYFGNQVDLIIDAGPTAGGLPSSIIDVSLGVPRLVRDGVLPLNELIKTCPILRF